MPVPTTGASWVCRVFRDTTPELRLFKLSRFGSMAVGVYDLNSDKPDQEIFFSKSDLQFLDYVEGPQSEEDLQTFKEETGDRKPDPAIIRSGDSRNDGGIRPERDGKDRVRRDVPQTPITPRHPGKGR